MVGSTAGQSPNATNHTRSPSIRSQNSHAPSRIPVATSRLRSSTGSGTSQGETFQLAKKPLMLNSADCSQGAHSYFTSTSKHSSPRSITPIGSNSESNHSLASNEAIKSPITLHRLSTDAIKSPLSSPMTSPYNHQSSYPVHDSSLRALRTFRRLPISSPVFEHSSTGVQPLVKETKDRARYSFDAVASVPPTLGYHNGLVAPMYPPYRSNSWATHLSTAHEEDERTLVSSEATIFPDVRPFQIRHSTSCTSWAPTPTTQPQSRFSNSPRPVRTANVRSSSPEMFRTTHGHSVSSKVTTSQVNRTEFFDNAPGLKTASTLDDCRVASRDSRQSVYSKSTGRDSVIEERPSSRANNIKAVM